MQFGICNLKFSPEVITERASRFSKGYMLCLKTFVLI